MRAIVSLVLAGAVAAGCSSQEKKRIVPADLPLVEPPVRAATPAGLLPPPPGALSVGGFETAFFGGIGPTDVLNLLRAIDDRLREFNARSLEQERPCLEQTPVAYDITAYGETTTFYAQCYDKLTGPNIPAGDPVLLQFGKKDGVTYLYSAVGQTRAAAVVTPTDGSPGEYTVRAWMGVGYLNGIPDGSGFVCGLPGTFDGCSYAAMSLKADSQARTYELAVAGINMGYCGAQLASDGTNIYAKGSEEGNPCWTPTDLCVGASDLAPPSVGDCAALTSFALPALGRKQANGAQSWAPSEYPGDPANIIELDGTSNDSIHFGPTEPTPGVSAFSTAGASGN